MSRRIKWYIFVINLSLPSSNTGPIKTCVFFFIACVILQIIFKFLFFSIRMLVRTSRVLLRWSHLSMCYGPYSSGNSNFCALIFSGESMHTASEMALRTPAIIIICKVKYPLCFVVRYTQPVTYYGLRTVQKNNL